MNGQRHVESEDLADKITRLVQERGWNQEDFVRITGLSRQTVRHILQQEGNRRLRNGTISRCASAFSLAVSELRNLPIERLLLRVSPGQKATDDSGICKLYEQATQPELLAWIVRNPDRANQLTADEMDELLSLQGTGGPLTNMGVEHYVDLLERKRRLIEQVHTIAGTEYLHLLEKLVTLMYEKVQPYADRR